MFTVQASTAKELFRAQEPKLQGKLRLDIASGSLPPDPDKPFDVRRACTAIGERFVHMIEGCGVEAVELGPADSESRKGFLPDAVPPPPDELERLLLMPDADTFEGFVKVRINRIFGLGVKSRHYDSALTQLAHDFNSWCGTDDALDDIVMDTSRGTVHLRCKSERATLPPLKPADRMWRLPIDR